MTSREILRAIAAVIRPTGLRVGDLPTVIAGWVSDDDGDDLGPDVVCRLIDGREVYWHDDTHVMLGRLVRLAGHFARRESDPGATALRAIRARLGLTQAGLAAALGVHRVTVVRWESGARPVSAPALRLAHKLLA